MKILVTGGSGFIGTHLVERLKKEGHKTVVFDKKEGNNVTDQPRLKRMFSRNHFDVVIHLAAEAGVRRSFEQPHLYFATNVGGTLNLLECLRENHKTRLIFASSSSVYGNSLRVPFKESDQVLQPVSPYAITKRAGELACQLYAKQYGIKTTILRLFTVYGPGNRQDMAAFTFTRDILSGHPIKLFGKNTKRDFTYIDDVVDGIVKAIQKPFDFEIINLGNSQPIMIKNLVHLLEKRCGKKALIKWAGLPAGDVVRTYADITRAKKLLDWSPRTPIQVGIEKLVDWFKLRS